MISCQNYKNYIKENSQCLSLANCQEEEPHVYFSFFTSELIALIDIKNKNCIAECFGLIEEIIKGHDSILEDAITTTVFIGLYDYYQNTLDLNVFMGGLSKELYAKTIKLWVSNQPK